MIIRPATREDIEAFSDLPDKPTMKAWVGELDGKIVGMAGFVFSKGRWLAFCDLLPEARKYKITIARAAIRNFQEIKKQGVRFVYAEMSRNEPTAERWLKSLGFERDPRTAYLYRWRS